jgi:mono/diheme cytochrome c family protein
MDRTRRSSVAVRNAVVAMVAGAGIAGIAQSSRAADVDFNKDIKPIFKQSCIKCHSLNNQRHKAAAGFSLDSRESALKGGDNAHDKDLIPGNSKDSIMVQLLAKPVNVDGEDIEAMPKHKKGEEFKPLPDDKIQLIKDWIDQGAKWGG